MSDAQRAEIVVVSGPLAGNRYAVELSPGDEFVIGGSSLASLRLPGTGIAPRHCVIRYVDDAWRISELSPGRGVFVNGIRHQSQPLRDGDQIEIGETDLVFRTKQIEETGAESGAASRGAIDDKAAPALLRACSLLFLFRALATATSDEQADGIEKTIIALIGDALPIRSGLVVLAQGETALRRRAAERNAAFADLVAKLAREGGVLQEEQSVAAVPIYARGELSGMIQLSMDPAYVRSAPEFLSGVAVLAAAAIENAREIETLRNRNALLSEEVRLAGAGLIGESTAMKRLRASIERVAPHDATVLILGESGTGKELVARALHRQSPRSAGPFVAVNCAALTETLLESELFGHEKGAFTGAVAQKKGKLELAEGGTVFLDEIGELAPGLQAKLLRVLQEREFDRVGGTKTIRLDVRLIAATNRDLAAQVRKGAFREDLYHRLKVIALHTTPLRQRPEDILPLARYFLARAAERHKRLVDGFSPEAEARLLSYAWPGNVRELENAIERAAVLGSSGSILEEDLPEELWSDAEDHRLTAAPAGLESSLDSTKRETIIRAWREAGGDYKAAAAILEVHPNSLLRSIRKMGLRDVLRGL